MWLLIFLCALASAIVIEEASVEDVNETIVFRKCCPRNQSLVKVIENGIYFDDRYDCIDRDSMEKKYNVLHLPLLISYNITVKYGLPAECDELQVIQVTDVEVGIKTSDNQCYDRLVMEIINGTLKQSTPKTIMLSCIRKDVDNVSTAINVTTSTSMFKIHDIRKCCPNGKSYDLEYHICRNTEDNNEEEWLMKRLKVEGDYIYEMKNGLQCKSDQFAVELKEEMFVLRVEGDVLNASGENGEHVGPVAQGEWCMDRVYEGAGLVARACTRDCSAAGAFCIRKCCHVGEHYRPRRCGSPVSVCVHDSDDGVLYNISSYLDPLKRKYDNFADVLGIRSDLRCPAGKFVLNNTSEKDQHQLTQEGLLESPNIVGRDYCIEAFDRRHCYGDVVVTAVVCFVEPPQTKDFFVSFLLNSISSICLALTLVVYCALPELRNLHGRTLICHVSMMLLAYSCLACVQYGKVPDKRVCTMLGYGIYFGFVAAFSWLNVMCLDIWWTFGSVRSVQRLRKAGAERRRFAWYSLYAWSVAVLLTLTMLILDLYPVASSLDANMGNGICWFGSVQNAQTDWPHYIFFVVPMGLVTCTNFVLWVLTARHCARVKSEVHRLQAGSVGDRAKRTFRIDRAKYVLTGKLWVVMGAGWISELLSTLASEPQWLWTIIDLFNELQGVFIFFILVFKPKLYYLIRKRLGCSRSQIDTRMEKLQAQKNGTSSTAHTSSTFLSRTISTDERTNLKISLPNK